MRLGTGKPMLRPFYDRLPRPRWAFAAVIVIALVLNALLVYQQLQVLFDPLAGVDYFWTIVPVTQMANPYDIASYLWSPVAVPLLTVIVALGWPAWLALHFLAVALLRPWWLAGLVLLSWPFWFDLGVSNVGTFIFVAAWWALRGNRPATLLFFAMAVLMPRPLMLPLTVWLLWQRPWTRLAFAVMFIGHLLLVLGSGFADEWWIRLSAVAGHELAHPLNVGPSHVLGAAWIPIGLALAAWLTWKGRLGWASLAASPYLFPFYLLFGLLELRPADLPAAPRA